MRFRTIFPRGVFFIFSAVLALPIGAFSQQPTGRLEPIAVELPEAPQPAGTQAPSGQSSSAQIPAEPQVAPPTAANPASQPIPLSKQQPKRILGIIPNYRAVSAGSIPPPPTPREAFKIATLNSFDYSSFFFVGITSLMAEGTEAHPQLGKGPEGFDNYFWRGLADKTSGNYLVIFALPSAFHQDERFFAKGQGSILGRGIYAASRVLITPGYNGRNGFNASEILGRGISQGISLSYYPKTDRTAGSLSEKYAYAVGRDALTNAFREFWPDIAVHVLHRHP
jgi:hypothetical protein